MPKFDKKKIISLIFISIVMITLTIILMPKMISLKDEDNRIKFKEYIDSFGPWGILMMIGIQILQVVVAIIPGEVVEILAGMMYGGFGGLVVCMIGNIVAATVIFFVVRLFKPVKFKANEEYKMINEKKGRKINLEKMTFIIFLIPGTPKDALCYAMPFTKIKYVNFIVISSIARIPSIVTSTIVGGSISKGNFWTALWVFIGSAIISLITILIYQYFEKKRVKKEEMDLNTTK